MKKKNKKKLHNKNKISEIKVQDFQTDVWVKLTPSERLARSWEMRKRLKNITKIHDEKLFPKP